MSKKIKRLGVSLILLVVLIISGLYLSRVNIPVLEPKGPVADKEFRLLLLITGLMLLVVIPVFLLLAYVVWRYREDNPRRARYEPEWEHSRWLEGLWWAIPTVLITIVSVITWNATYSLNPYLALNSNKAAIPIQVISLDWKWLFIYPDQHIASVNSFELPQKTPIHFYLTSDAPMNSFWLPQLSGQIFTMAGMQTQLYLSSDVLGTFYGRSANISGVGFASMQFSARSVSQDSFNSWVDQVKQRSPTLGLTAYKSLRQPSVSIPSSTYAYPASELFNRVMASYMVAPPNASSGRT
ncbi:MAG: COX aromatic rich motif-containing protein [Candidatus Saccharimonadales bacterium]